MADRKGIRRRARSREGVSLIELVVAITFLGVVLASIAALTTEAAQQATILAGQSRRQAALTEEVNRLTAMPFAALTPGLGACRVLNEPGFVHTRCVSVTALTTYVRRVQVIVTPRQRGTRPDTVTFVRANPPAISPLKTS